jgi:excinuclease ABC subunit C
LQQIRDEAHRVAISYHRKRRSKRLIQTELDHIPGIGPKKRALLLKYFGSVKQIKKVSREALENVEGLSRRDIDELLKFWK